MKHTPQAHNKSRSERPFAALNRARWNHYLENPSSQLMLQTKCGKATQKRFLVDIAVVMDTLVSNMCLRTRKVGTIAKNGFFLFTWDTIAKKAGLPVWRVKQCASRIIENGWLESTQPRGTNAKQEYVCLASIKRITYKYIEQTGLKKAFIDAHAAAKKSVEKLAKRYQTKVKYLLTPITLLAKFEARRSTQRPVAPPS
ncbi:hypothetical protein [Shewanella gelidii]|uniref:Uncharacterized protein n=1 Tax=Shewanella gelidii TaxID=1642821 RepID=A0A917JWV4_9GAMM|nr:hypothetical protein [Shewanella gelidii]MCL1098063.1 hypothetical protein [Shewanella gelidii]GGI85866.1 hypothetical protein GCM10009332_23960 [Shewanella gelidii]